MAVVVVAPPPPVAPLQGATLAAPAKETPPDTTDAEGPPLDVEIPQSRILFDAPGRFGRVFVVEEDGVRVLRFDVASGAKAVDQSAWDPSEPHRPQFEYVRVAGLALGLLPGLDDAPSSSSSPSPSSAHQRTETPRALVLGLGGGAWPRLLLERHSRLRVDGVEIDPVVVKAAHAHLGLPHSPRLRVIVDDAAAFVAQKPAGRRSGTNGANGANGAQAAGYDLILLDAFTGAGIPPTLTTTAFFEAVRALLRPDGVAIMNLALEDAADSALLESRFAGIFGGAGEGDRIAKCVRVMSRHEDNRVLFAGAGVGQASVERAVERSAVILGFDLGIDVETVALCGTASR